MKPDDRLDARMQRAASAVHGRAAHRTLAEPDFPDLDRRRARRAAVASVAALALVAVAAGGALALRGPGGGSVRPDVAGKSDDRTPPVHAGEEPPATFWMLSVPELGAEDHDAVVAALESAEGVVAVDATIVTGEEHLERLTFSRDQLLGQLEHLTGIGSSEAAADTVVDLVRSLPPDSPLATGAHSVREWIAAIQDPALRAEVADAVAGLFGDGSTQIAVEVEPGATVDDVRDELCVEEVPEVVRDALPCAAGGEVVAGFAPPAGSP